ncbi:MAG TPA: hypothetical protein VNW92_25205 [Polyangiaceae bacterium]|jgi:hypothetical protein|nr:hypothetical protein [Polyangiaceae bacterium]
MARFAVPPRRFRGGVLLAVLLGVVAACQPSVSEQARVAAREQDPSTPCALDETREYFCDDLLPLSSSRPAPEPYDNCPASVDTRPGAYKPVGRVAGFDKGYTEYTRHRVQPGHSCCYSWCVKVELADPTLAAPAQCRDAYGMHENFCMRELETGTSEPAASPYDRCPLSVKPPEISAFSAPTSAMLDVAHTTQRRQDTKLPECCYGWCSKAPARTVLKSHPKTK